MDRITSEPMVGRTMLFDLVYRSSCRDIELT